jgi:cytochrome oxidase Cu insertion factor (SCO1/SenC/PrrC family)
VTRAASLLPLVVLLIVGGCDAYDRPRRPLPAAFEVRTLDGQVLTAETLRGRPWVVNIWVPG